MLENSSVRARGSGADIRASLEWGRRRLGGEMAGSLEAEMLLGYVMGVGRTWLHAHADESIGGAVKKISNGRPPRIRSRGRTRTNAGERMRIVGDGMPLLKLVTRVSISCLDHSFSRPKESL